MLLDEIHAILKKNLNKKAKTWVIKTKNHQTYKSDGVNAYDFFISIKGQTWTIRDLLKIFSPHAKDMTKDALQKFQKGSYLSIKGETSFHRIALDDIQAIDLV